MKWEVMLERSLILTIVSMQKKPKGDFVICYFPDEIWFCIYNILFFDIFSAEEKSSESQNSSLQCFYGMVLISKTDYARLLRYLKKKPQIVSFGCACCSNKWLKKIAWVGKKSVKLSDLTIKVNFDDNVAMNLYFHLLQSCNIIEMQTLTIVQFSSEAQFSRHPASFTDRGEKR